MPILLAKVSTNNVPDSPGKWRVGEIVTAVEDGHIFGTQEVPSAGNFYHITITDKTLEEVQSYLQSWSHDPVVIQISATGDDRLIGVTSTMVSASGDGAFTAGPIDDMLADIAAEFTESNPVRTALTNFTFEFTITAPVGARDDIIERVNQAVRDMAHKRRRWYVTQAGRTFLAGNGGTVSGTSAQVSVYLRDGLLD